MNTKLTGGPTPSPSGGSLYCFQVSGVAGTPSVGAGAGGRIVSVTHVGGDVWNFCVDVSAGAGRVRIGVSDAANHADIVRI